MLSSDLFASSRALKEQIVAIAEGAADIIIGTQIVAKGHNFPLLTLVGVIDADLGLQGSDLRAAERTFQLMRQVAGRAGRAEKPGEAWLQTFQPEHPVIRAILSGEEEAFWQAEAAERRAAGAPPYGRMAGIILSGPDMARSSTLPETSPAATALCAPSAPKSSAPPRPPSPGSAAATACRLLVKAAKSAPLQPALAAWVGANPAAHQHPPCDRHRPAELSLTAKEIERLSPQSFVLGLANASPCTTQPSCPAAQPPAGIFLPDETGTRLCPFILAKISRGV